jgi:hypothetical protein
MLESSLIISCILSNANEAGCEVNFYGASEPYSLDDFYYVKFYYKISCKGFGVCFTSLRLIPALLQWFVAAEVRGKGMYS